MTSDSGRSTMIHICFITHFSYDKIPNNYFQYNFLPNTNSESTK